MELIEQLKDSEIGKIVITFFISMLPVIELRGAIPVGVSMGLSTVTSMIVSVIGNMVPIPFIILFIRRVFEWMRKKSPRLARLAERLENKAYSKRDVLYKGEIVGLIILVAIPLPGTGAWTGALIAALLNIRLKVALPAVGLGVMIAGILVSGITHGFSSLV